MASNDTFFGPSLFCSWCAWFLLIPVTFIVAVCVPWSTVKVHDSNVYYDDYGDIIPDHLSFTIECRSSDIQIDGERITYSKIIEDWNGEKCVPNELLPIMETQDWYKPEDGTCDFTYHRRAKRTMVGCFVLIISFGMVVLVFVLDEGDTGDIAAALMTIQFCATPFMMIIFAVVMPFPFSDNMCGKTAHLTTEYIVLICLIVILIVWPPLSCGCRFLEMVYGDQSNKDHRDGHDKWRTLRQAFKSMDSNGNAFIEPDELKSMAPQMFKCNQSQCDLLFAEIDVNGSGRISFAEFDGWIKRIGGIEAVDQRIAALQDEVKESAAEVITKEAQNGVITDEDLNEVNDDKNMIIADESAIAS